MATETWRGKIAERDFGEAMDVLTLEEDEPLAEAIKDAIAEHGAYLTVRYHITDEEQPSDALNENLVKLIIGAGDADYSHAYSEITGYLWTDEEINVGGHDLLAELRSHKGRFCHLEITFEAPPATRNPHHASGPHQPRDNTTDPGINRRAR